MRVLFSTNQKKLLNNGYACWVDNLSTRSIQQIQQLMNTAAIALIRCLGHRMLRDHDVVSYRFMVVSFNHCCQNAQWPHRRWFTWLCLTPLWRSDAANSW